MSPAERAASYPALAPDIRNNDHDVTISVSLQRDEPAQQTTPPLTLLITRDRNLRCGSIMSKRGLDPVLAAELRVRTPLSATSITPFSMGTFSLVVVYALETASQAELTKGKLLTRETTF